MAKAHQKLFQILDDFLAQMEEVEKMAIVEEMGELEKMEIFVIMFLVIDIFLDMT